MVEEISRKGGRPDSLLQTRAWKLMRVDRSSGEPQYVETTISLDSDDKYSKATLEVIESIEISKGDLRRPFSTDPYPKIEAYKRSLRQYDRHLDILKGRAEGIVEFVDEDGVITAILVDTPAK